MRTMLVAKMSRTDGTLFHECIGHGCDICKRGMDMLKVVYEEVSDEEFEEIKAAQGKGWDEELQREVL